MPHAVLALDQGTTGSTALVYSREGEVLGRAYSEFPQYFPRPGWVEHDPEEIWTVSLATMAGAVADASLGPADLAAIGITNQRETTVVWERRSGRPVHRAIGWQSRQTAELCERLRAAGHEPLIRRKTGLVADAYFSGTKVRWILDLDPELRRRSEAGELCFGTIDTWMLWRLTGGAVHATEPTNASRTLLFDIHARRWDEELLDILGVPRALLPRVADSSSEIFGETAGSWIGDSLPVGIPIAGMAGDQQAALFGQGCWYPGQAKNTYGTGCFLLMNVGEADPDAAAGSGEPGESEGGAGGLLTTLGCDSRGRPVYCLEGPLFTAGAAVQWLRDQLGLIRVAA
ncbi:MAG: glycerol kinase, partial [Holophagales bacterium]|nr:glycerol kinase [Holophagales bacterium]